MSVNEAVALNGEEARLELRKSEERGKTELDWLLSRHTFSFGDYYDPAHMGFRSLRVINEDIVKPGSGFDTHPHRDMEIITIVLAGELQHRDNLGRSFVLRAGEVQVMSAGSGVLHSEYNFSQDLRTHFLQIWIRPEQLGLTPAYARREFSWPEFRNKLCKIVGHQSAQEDTALKINQDVSIYLGSLVEKQNLVHKLIPGRGAWVQLITGKIIVNGVELNKGDGLAVEGQSELNIENPGSSAEVVIFDLA